MGPTGVAEPHCLNQCPAHPFPPGSWLFAGPAGEAPGLRQAFPAFSSQQLAGINDGGQGRWIASLPVYIISRDRCGGIAGLHRAWGEEAAKTHPSLPTCPADRLSSICFLSAGGEGGRTLSLSPPRPTPFLFLETKWPQFSTLVPVRFTCFSQSHKTPASRKHNADTLPRQPSPLPPFPEYAIALVPVCRPGPLLCMRRPLPSAQRRCCVCPGGHILYIYFLLQSLSLEKLYIILIFK